MSRRSNVERKHTRNILIMMITLFSSIQVMFEIKTNTNFHSHESYPLIKAIFGRPVENEVIRSMEDFALRSSNSLIVTNHFAYSLL